MSPQAYVATILTAHVRDELRAGGRYWMIPLYMGLLGLSVWLLYSSARYHGSLTPFWSGFGAALVALLALWIHAALV